MWKSNLEEILVSIKPDLFRMDGITPTWPESVTSRIPNICCLTVRGHSAQKNQIQKYEFSFPSHFLFHRYVKIRYRSDQRQRFLLENFGFQKIEFETLYAAEMKTIGSTTAYKKVQFLVEGRAYPVIYDSRHGSLSTIENISFQSDYFTYVKVTRVSWQMLHS